MNDIHSFFTDRIHNISADIGGRATNITEDEIIHSIDQTMSALKWMMACLNSDLVGEEVSIVASEILKEI